MNNVEGPSSLLNKINQLNTELDKNNTNQNQEMNFEKFLKDAFDETNSLQLEAKESMKKFLSGETDDVNQVMEKMSKSELSFNLTMKIKEKLIDAYQKLERMRI